MMKAVVAAAIIVAAALRAPLCVQGRGVAPERTTVLDNATVAVTRVHFDPGSREETHTHPFPLLIVQQTNGQATVTDREMLRVGQRAGEVWFIPAGTPHAVSNRSNAPIEMLAVGIKTDRPQAPAAPPTEAPEGIVRATLVDNADVRVVRVRFSPDAREPLHTHPNDLLTIQITRGRVEILNGAQRSTADREPGFVQFLPRNVQHAFASADTAPFELLSVSIK
jgi:quercetin dioxygenase-like cupin family protein